MVQKDLPTDEGPFARLIGIRTLVSDGGKGKAVMPVREDHLQNAGVVQGGIIATLVDHVLYLAVRSLLKPNESSVTVELKVNFISPARDGELVAEARVASRGNRIIVGDVEVRDGSGELVALALSTYMVRRGAAGEAGTGDSLLSQ